MTDDPAVLAAWTAQVARARASYRADPFAASRSQVIHTAINHRNSGWITQADYDATVAEALTWRAG